ncbi:MAG: SDR family NAD(P)-dependent oxidoreductase [Rhodospirillaceae bacterium]
MAAAASTVLVFGASGAIGTALVDRFRQSDWSVAAVSRSPQDNPDPAINWVCWEVGAGAGDLAKLAPASVHAVVWAQGMNCNDDIYDFDAQTHETMYRANVLSIMESLQVLLQSGKLAPAARLCVISSIWQNIVRTRKLSYCVTKSALQGMVQSLAIDLGEKGILVNAVLPGALDTPMTRANLQPEQIDRLQSMTPLATLPQLEDVCNLVFFLCSDQNTGLTGQFIAADRGFSYAKFL